MKKLSVFLKTPAGVVIAVGVIMLLSELLIMLLVGSVIASFPKLKHELWNYITPILLAAIASTALYILVLRSMHNQQAGLERQLDELHRFQKVTVGRELCMKKLMEEIAALRNPLFAEPAGDIPVPSGSLEAPRHAAEQLVTTQPIEESQRSALLFMLEDLEAGRKKIEQAHHEWMDALDAVNDPIFLHDKQFRVLHANRAYQKCAGIRLKEIIGQPYYEIFPKVHAPPPCCLRATEKAEEVEVFADGAIYRLRAFFIHDEQSAYLYSVHTLEDITESRRIGVALHESEQKFMRFFMLVPVPLGVVNKDGVIVYFNDRFTKVFGYTTDDVPTLKEWWQLAYPDESYRQWVMDSWGAAVAKAAKEGTDIEPAEYRVTCKSGAERIVMIGGTTLEDNVLATFIDITEHKRAEEALKGGEEKYRSIYENTQVGLYRTRVSDGKLIMANDAMAKMFGFDSVEEATAKYVTSEQYVDPEAREKLLDILRKYGKFDNLEARMTRNDGIVRWFQYSGQLVQNKSYIEGVATDITERKQAEEEIEHLAFYDPLTRLPNRRLLLDRLKQALASSARSGLRGALLFIDLDNFKNLNDTLGHDIGDLLLQQVAQRLESCVREGDTVARLGGDEFVVMLEDLSEHALEAAAHTETVGNKILATLNQPYQLDTHEHHSTPSIGATLFNDHEQGKEELLKQADIAMYQAKKAGRNTQRFFDPAMQAAISTRVALESDLRRAVSGQEQFLLYYQAQVDSSGRLIGAEALVRWQHPERGLVSPAEFIPLAEESGLILPLGHWVLTTTCRQLAAWAAQPETARLTVAVNISAKQFHLPTFVEEVLSLVDYFGVDPAKLKLEITESLLLDNVDDIIAKMIALKARGISFSMDDFGTGYSSLQYLKRLPLDQLKIDRSFVHNISADESDKAIVRTIIAMAQSLNLSVIAEGVETEAQRQLLMDKGCTAYQGYLFCRPVPIEQFEALLKQG